MRTLALAVLLLVPSLSLAEDAKKPEEKFVSLFDGKTLDGWKVEKCEVEVQDGCIFLKAGNGWMYAEKKYGDFVLELEWKGLNKDFWDSGVYVRSPERPERANWPDPCQINLRKDMLYAVKEYKDGAPARTEIVKPGEWNHMRVTASGKTVSLEANGQPVWKIENFRRSKGYIGLQCEVPGGGQFLFRNVRISER